MTVEATWSPAMQSHLPEDQPLRLWLDLIISDAKRVKHVEMQNSVGIIIFFV